MAKAPPTRTLGKTGFQVSTVGYGTWQLGGCWSQSDEKDAHKAALHAYLDSGANLLDTANVYGGDYGTDAFGASEKLIREVLDERKAAGKEERVYVCTKAGRGPSDAAPGDHGPERYTYEALSQSLAASAERLGVTTVDLLQLHCPPPEVLVDGSDTYKALRQLKDEGRISHWGVSVETIDEAMMAIAQEDCATIQIIFNMLRLRPAEAFLAKAREKNVGTLIRLPYASGLLTGKITEAYIDSLEPSDHRVFNVSGTAFDKGETWSGLGEHLKTVALPAVDEYKAIYQGALDRGELEGATSFGNFALRWILDHEGTTAVIPGARSEAQVSGNLAAAFLPPLSPEVHSEVKGVYDKLVKEIIEKEPW